MSLSSELLPGVPLVESPLFSASLPDMNLSSEEQEIALSLNSRGYAVIDFPDPAIEARIDRIKSDLAPEFEIDLADPASIKVVGDQRIQDAWKSNDDVRSIAVNEDILTLLGKLYGRRAIPFQTLNFPVGTQQHLHSDSIHFSSQPERFMCGVWLAMEDVRADAGPLEYCVGSHKWPIVTNAMIGKRRWNDRLSPAQAPYEAVWRELIAASGKGSECFLAKKGQALIWAANLLHGGSRQKDPTLTRWSQVTHYYFENCLYYTPAYSEESRGLLDMRSITNIATGRVERNMVQGEDVSPHVGRERPALWQRLMRRDASNDPQVPVDFNGETYYRLNPDIAASGHDPAQHYIVHGKSEGRRYRID